MATKEEFEQSIKNAYQEMDINKDGVISKNEIQALMSKMFGKPVPQKVIDEVMRTADADNSGSINSIEELVHALSEIEIILICSELAEKFKELDADGNGKLTREEIEKGWSRVSKGGSVQEMNDIINKADADGDGKIDCEEFINFILEEMMSK